VRIFLGAQDCIFNMHKSTKKPKWEALVESVCCRGCAVGRGAVRLDGRNSDRQYSTSRLKDMFGRMSKEHLETCSSRVLLTTKTTSNWLGLMVVKAYMQGLKSWKI